MSQLPNALEHRRSDHEIEPLFLKRWSPRAMNGEPVNEATLSRLFEAARWAASSYNEQEWRFLYAHRNSSHWETFFGLLMEANQVWCAKAGVLMVVVSKKTFTRNGKPNGVHSLDTGMAVGNLLLQTASLELVGHGMAGFNASAARQQLQIPEDFQVECMIAIGHPGNPLDLPESYRAMEIPSGRKPIDEFAKAGPFAF
jgi:nitroreductase